MNLYYITDELLDNRSVETIHINEICKNLAVLGHSIRLFAPTPINFQMPKEYSADFIKRSNLLFSVFFQSRLFLCLYRNISRYRPDIIYSRHNQLLFIPALICRLFGIPLVLEVNGRLVEEMKSIDRSFIVRVLVLSGMLKFLESFNVKSANQLIVVAPGIKEYLIQNYKINSDKVVIIQNGVDTELFKPDDRSAAREKLALDKDLLYIGYIGSFYSWQGLRYIAQAAQLVLAKRNVKFLIIGKGDEGNYLRSFVKEEKLEHGIEIRSAVSHNFVPTYISAFDICLCYPIKFRDNATSPFKVYEYLAGARAVVLADIGGMRKEFGNAVSYAEPESAIALADALISLIDDKDKRRRLGERGRAFVEQGHSWQRVSEQIAVVCFLVIA